MRTFKVIAGERLLRGDNVPLVEFIISDIEKGVAIRCDLHYGVDGRTRDEAYAMLKDVAAASIRQRVADDVGLPHPPGCPHGCVRGYLPLFDGGVVMCNNPTCLDYAEAVVKIGDKVDISVIYRPGTHENGDFNL